MTHLLERFRSRISTVLDGHQLDLEYFHYVINQEVFILSSASTIFDVSNDILETLIDLQKKFMQLFPKRWPLFLWGNVVVDDVNLSLFPNVAR